MTWSDTKGLVVISLSSYTAKRSKLIRSGRYTHGDHYQDGYVAMLYETLQDLSTTDQLYPFNMDGVRRLIFAYNRLTEEKVPDVWKD